MITSRTGVNEQTQAPRLPLLQTSNSPDITAHERYATGSLGLLALGAPAPALGFSSNRREHWPRRQSSRQHTTQLAVLSRGHQGPTDGVSLLSQP